jgi:hypothetical protein
VARVTEFPQGGYRYIEGVFQYSGGVAAETGFAIERVRFRNPLPLNDGFAAAETHMRTMGRPTTSLCACELRSPEQFTEHGFTAFNKHYVGLLERWGVYAGGRNPVARTNVCPEYGKPSEVTLFAFSYTVPTRDARRTFVISGSGEAREGEGRYRDSIVRLGDTSVDGLREKVQFVTKQMQSRLSALGFTWRDASSTQAYTIHDIGRLASQELFGKGIAPGGLEWHFCRPPVIDIEFEMDVRGSALERML